MRRRRLFISPLWHALPCLTKCVIGILVASSGKGSCLIKEPTSTLQSLYDVRATVPVQLTAKNGASLSVVHSTFSTLPWPGIYVYNVSRDIKLILFCLQVAALKYFYIQFKCSKFFQEAFNSKQSNNSEITYVRKGSLKGCVAIMATLRGWVF